MNVRQISWELNIPGDRGWIARLVTLLRNVLRGSAVAAIAPLLGFRAIIAWGTVSLELLKALE